MGMDLLQLAVFSVEKREENPATIMPWEWDEYMETVTQQIEVACHMNVQYALEGKDYLRSAHIWGPHWYIQPWEPSPNDRRA